MADVFSCHTVPPLDPESQKRILKSYGTNVPEGVIDTIIDIWQDLREAHEKGVMVYPFSVREAVSVVKGSDGATDIVEDSAPADPKTPAKATQSDAAAPTLPPNQEETKAG